MDSIHQNVSDFQNHNPLVCFVCQDYYNEPCLLQCYHTFCARCLRGRDIDGKISCPLCGQQTQLREGSLPPPDLLLAQLLELANSENPPCSNCDIRDRNNMYYCNTCGQALCNHCRENTHRAKMFSTHEVVHMSKCAKEPKKCPIHGEQYIMYSNVQKTMLCVNCFRDTVAEKRSFCVDIDTAYNQATKRLERAQGGISELQNSIREGIIMFKNLLDELRQNMDTEKHTINTFCQGMQEAIAKTHANMIMEVQRQFETKEKVFRNQLMALGAVLPTLQLHLMMCTNFINAANKFQFLELAYLMFDRLNAVTQLSIPLRPLQSSTIRTNYRNEFAQSLEPWVGKAVLSSMDIVPSEVIYESTSKTQRDTAQMPSTGQNAPSQQTMHPTKKQQNIMKMKLLEEESPFSNHCRTFESQLKELCQQLAAVKERLEELHHDVTLLRRENLPPVSMRYECISRDCTLLDETLEKHLNDLDRLKVVFDAIWEDQLRRIHVEQEIFHSQISDIVMLRNELKRLSTIAQQLEPFIKNQIQQSGSTGTGGGDEDQIDAQTILANQQNLQQLLEHIGLLQSENLQLKSECKLHPMGSTTTVSTDGIALGDTIPVREIPKNKNRATSSSDLTSSRRSTSGLGISSDTHSTEQKRNVISQLIEKVNRRKSPTDEFRGHQTCSNVSCVKEKERAKSTSDVQTKQLTKEKSFIKSGSKQAGTSGIQQTTSATIERLESHIKEKFHDILNRRQSKLIEDGVPTLPSSSGGKPQKTHQVDDQKYPKNIELQIDSALQKDFANLVHRKISRNDLEKLALLSQTTKALDTKKIGKSVDRINELKTLKVAPSDVNVRQKFTHARSKTPDSAQRFCSKSTEGTISGTAHRSKTTDKICEKYRSKTPTDASHSSHGSKIILESEYQHISNATSSLKSDKGKYKQNRSTPSSPKGSTRKSKVYPHSDGEEEFYRRQQSGERSGHKGKSRAGEVYPCGTIKKSPQQRTPYRQNSFESLSTLSLNSRRSSLENIDKALVLVIGTRNKNASGSNKSLNRPVTPTQQPQRQHSSKSEKGTSKKSDKSDFSLKQRSWETFPPKKHRANGNRSYHYYQLMDNAEFPKSATIEKKEPSERKETEKFATITKSISVQKRSLDGKSIEPSISTPQPPQPVKTPTKRVSQRQQKMIAERGYYSEYELDFDTDNPDEGEMSDNIFGFDTELKLAIDRRAKGYKPNYQPTARDYPAKFSTFKGDTQSQIHTFKDNVNVKSESSSEKQSHHLSTFKGSSTSHMSTFKGDKAVLSSFKSDGSTSSSFKGESLSLSTFKGEPSSPHIRKFQGYFKGESSQSLSSYDQRQSTNVPGEEGMKKADSFEGHEEAVRTLVAAVQETRSAAARKTK